MSNHLYKYSSDLRKVLLILKLEHINFVNYFYLSAVHIKDIFGK